MTDDEAKMLMERHGITSSQHVVYYYQGFKYGSLTEALNYAERNASRAHEGSAETASTR